MMRDSNTCTRNNYITWVGIVTENECKIKGDSNSRAQDEHPSQSSTQAQTHNCDKHNIGNTIKLAEELTKMTTTKIKLSVCSHIGPTRPDGAGSGKRPDLRTLICLSELLIPRRLITPRQTCEHVRM